MLKYLVGLVVIIIIAVGGYYVWEGFGGSGAPPTDTTEQVQQPTTSTYATTSFSVVYPSDFTSDDKYAYAGFPKKPIAGVKLTIPGAMAAGTNLSNDTYVSVETLPNAKKCTGDIYLVDDVNAHVETQGGVNYSIATSSDAGAGNFREEMVYALRESSPCVAIRYFIHSTNIGNYLPAQAGDPGTVREFDRAALLSSFDAIRASVRLAGDTATSTAPAPSTSTP